MASNVINRYVWLLNTLLQHKELSLKEISKLWKYIEWNTRQILRGECYMACGILVFPPRIQPVLPV